MADGEIASTRAENQLQQRPSNRQLAVLFFVVLAIHALSPSVQVTDSRLSVPTAYAVLNHRTLALDEVPSVPRALEKTRYDVVEKDGRLLPFFPWPPMLFALPGVAAAQAVGVDVGGLGPSNPNRTWPIEIPTAAVLIALATVVVALTGAFVTKSSREALFIAIVFAFATSVWSTGSRSLWQHTPATLFWAVAVLSALRSRDDRRYLWLLGAACGLAFAMRPTGAIAVVGFTGWAVYAYRREAWRVVAGGMAIAIPFLLVNIVTYEALLPPYFDGNRLGSEIALPFVEAAAVLLFSPSRGLFIYSPLVFLVPVGLWMRHRAGTLVALDVVLAVMLPVHWLVTARYGPTGGSAYGNRFFTELMPVVVYLAIPPLVLVLAAASRRPARVVVASLVVVSFAMTVPGAVARSAFCWSASPRFIDEAPERVWDWSDPQFFRPVQRLRAGDSLRSIVAGSCTESTPASG